MPVKPRFYVARRELVEVLCEETEEDKNRLQPCQEEKKNTKGA